MHEQRNKYEIKRVKQVFDTGNALAVVACPENIYDKYHKRHDIVHRTEKPHQKPFDRPAECAVIDRGEKRKYYKYRKKADRPANDLAAVHIYILFGTRRFLGRGPRALFSSLFFSHFLTP